MLFISTKQPLPIHPDPQGYVTLLANLKERIRLAQYEAAKVVNTQMISLYWDTGKKLSELQKEGWGKSVVESLSKDIQKEFSGINGFGTSNLVFESVF